MGAKRSGRVLALALVALCAVSCGGETPEGVESATPGPAEGAAAHAPTPETPSAETPSAETPTPETPSAETPTHETPSETPTPALMAALLRTVETGEGTLRATESLRVDVECGGCEEREVQSFALGSAEQEPWFRAVRAATTRDHCEDAPLPGAPYPRCRWAAFNYPELFECEGSCCRGNYEEFGTGDEFLNFMEACFEQSDEGLRLSRLTLEDG